MQVFSLSWGTSALEKIQEALGLWSEWYSKIFNTLVETPAEFQGGTLWTIVTNIMQITEAVGVSLLILFFLYGIIKSTLDFRDLIRNPRLIFMQFIRFFFAKFFVIHATEIMLSVMNFAKNIILQIGGTTPTMDLQVPAELQTALQAADWDAGLGAWVTATVGGWAIVLLSIILFVVVYGRLFKIFLLSAVAPIPLAGFASEATSSIGQNFLKSYIGECLRGVLMLTACLIFSAFTMTSPDYRNATAGSMTLDYVGNVIMQLLLLVVIVKGSDRMMKEIFAL